ncbi:hypothetical protein UGJNECP4_00073 [Escherichia phage UGJNEcP4]|uniref:Uncharacterized protein n=3 Tax=Dhakavirus TaxID=1914165 RepID=A0A858I556_9CAUD|nr:hypothetical protein EcWhh1_163 [Escherichia phage EcWhh-1]QIN95909.1 hypothetical protein MN04_00120 [Escherichia phage MN04]CAH1615734.1 hypothetical protein UGJNECP3_00182 [Escherichia phage UGJNEcP3]CAH1616672.1 hypothetical protein UGJNECP4_00073 [Escherichia phage UGJNEcP4]CAI9865976.1 hypothetical protein PFGHJN_00218 [Escherichia phage UP19]
MIKIKLSNYDKNLEMIAMKEELLNDVRFTGYAVQFNGDGALQIEGDHFIIEYEFKRYWLYAKDEVGGIDYVDEFDNLDDALEGARFLQ